MSAPHNRMFFALACCTATMTLLVSGLYLTKGNNLVGCVFGICAFIWIVLAVCAGRRLNAAAAEM
jgi:hypothetical protein